MSRESLDSPNVHFHAQLDGLVEKGHTYIERLYQLWAKEKAPFKSRDELRSALLSIIDTLNHHERVQLIQCHPELVGRLADLPKESLEEQKAAGLINLTDEERDLFRKCNRIYKEKFQFPFVICAKQNKKEAILAAFPVRTQHTRDEEIATAIGEIKKIISIRIDGMDKAKIDARFVVL